MVQFFFELLRVALGTQSKLSRNLSWSEWDSVYNISEKHSLIGICFAGVQKLQVEQKPQVLLYLQWLGVTAQIQKRNEQLNSICAKLSEEVSESNIECSILKGQAFANLYGSLSSLRQSGDIDVWLKTSPQKVLEWGELHGTITFYDYHHADFSCDSDIAIELHYRPSLSRNLIRNYKLQRWFQKENCSSNNTDQNGLFPVPGNVFSIVLALNHNFWHLMYEGIGLRQFVDLYFILRASDSSERHRAMSVLKHFDLVNFTSATMYVMQTVFGLEAEYLLCEPNPEEGAFLLSEIMQAGNFGQFDNRIVIKQNEGRISTMVRWCKHNARLFKHYPKDVLWTPFGIMYISLWKRLNFKIKIR